MTKEIMKFEIDENEKKTIEQALLEYIEDCEHDEENHEEGNFAQTILERLEVL